MGKKYVTWAFLGLDNNCYKCLKHYWILNNEVVCGQHWTADNCPWPLSCIAVFHLSVSNRHSFLLYTFSRFKALLAALSPFIFSLRQLSAEVRNWIRVFVWGNGITSQHHIQGQKNNSTCSAVLVCSGGVVCENTVSGVMKEVSV